MVNNQNASHGYISSMNDAAETPVQFGQLDSVQDIEHALLASASAVQRLVAERDAFRSRVETLQSELTLLRQQTTLIHDSYRRLTTEYITQFRLIDSAVTNLFGERAESAGAGPAEQQPAEPSNAA